MGGRRTPDREIAAQRWKIVHQGAHPHPEIWLLSKTRKAIRDEGWPLAVMPLAVDMSKIWWIAHCTMGQTARDFPWVCEIDPRGQAWRGP